jgi:hypothetical protein
VKERIRRPENKHFKITEAIKKKKKTSEERLRDGWHKIKQNNICIMLFEKEKESGKG